MSTASAEPGTPNTGRGTFWALVPVALLASSLTGVLVMASIARSDPGFALEANYYERATHWDERQREWAESARLGFQLLARAEVAGEGVELVATLTDRAGAKLSTSEVRVDAFANARAGDVRHLTLKPQGDGSYRVSLGDARPGLWEFRFVVIEGGARFVEVVRADVPERRASP